MDKCVGIMEINISHPDCCGYKLTPQAVRELWYMWWRSLGYDLYHIHKFCFIYIYEMIYSSILWDALLCAGPRINIKTVFLRYGDSHVYDKTVDETVLS